MGAFFVRYGSTRIRFLYVFGLLIRGTFEAPAWIMLPMWFAMQLFMAALTSGSQPEGGVAYWAHVGGFAFGAGVALAMKEWRIEERFLHPAIESRTNLTVLSNPVVDEALEARRTGDLDRAFRMLSAEARSNPANRDGAIALWSLATDLGRPADAVPALLGTIEHSLRSGDDLGALESWEELAELVPEPTADAGLLVRLAEGYLRNSCPDNALVTLRRALLAGGGGMDGALALRIARLARDLDPTVARGALDLTLRREDLDPDVRMRAQQILADLN